MRVAADPRVWLPAAVAVLCWLPRARPEPPPPPPPRATAVALPPFHGLPPAKQSRRFVLDAARSSARFGVLLPDSLLLVGCPEIAGSLELGSDGTGSCELTFDLASLEPLGAARAQLDLPELLGVHRSDTVHYRANLAAVTGSDLPGVSQLTWLGTLRLGPLQRAQAMQMWQCALPGQSLRFLGHGDVATRALGPPPPRWFGFEAPARPVLLGLDLAWRRDHGR
jgi:hypothetical protein